MRSLIHSISMISCQSVVMALVLACSAATPTNPPTMATPRPQTPTSFTSALYGYTLTVPAGWSNTAATSEWDGAGSPSSGDVVNDRWGSAGDTMWGRAAAFEGDLESFAADSIEATADVHGDTCPDPPEGSEDITIGGEPGTFLAWDCGILINYGVTVHDGVGYFFGYRDPAVHAATDPADRATFLALLASVQFPA